MNKSRSEFYANRDLARAGVRSVAELRAANAAILSYDRKRATQRAKERIARLAYCCAILALGVALFYSI